MEVPGSILPGLAGLGAEGALVAEAADVGLHMLLHGVPELAAVVALGALPDGLAQHGVVGGHHQLGHLPAGWGHMLPF